MDSIFFENIRCFASRQEVPLAPLTVLVGENSSGKSTVLALVRLAWDLWSGRPLYFNEEPFFLGTYEQIARKVGEEISPSFELGLHHHGADLSARFSPHAGQPTVASMPQLTLTKLKGPRPYAFAPIRTRPQRTYDPIADTERPEGSHVPMVLAHGSLIEPARWQKIFSALDSFGSQSGLFSKVEVRRLGQSGDPFQIQVQIEGITVNLIDAGYGVSQALSIVVDCLRGEEGGTFLLQQPEVHLHPRVQAELGSFLGVLGKQQNKRFIIETHSDHLVDRIRMDIRDGKGLTPEDVSLLYFERKNGQANIHRLHLDEYGNLLDPPPGYRDFFLEEALRFLGPSPPARDNPYGTNPRTSA